MTHFKIYDQYANLAYYDKSNIITLIDNQKMYTTKDVFLLQDEDGKRLFSDQIKFEQNKNFNKISIKLIEKWLNPSKYHYLIDSNNNKIPIMIGQVVLTPEFDVKYSDPNFEYGAIWKSEGITFRIWSPLSKNAKLVLFDKELNQKTVHEMKPVGNGSWEILIEEKHEYIYRFRVENDFKVKETIDPYAKNSTLNATHSILLHPSKDQIKRYETNFKSQNLLDAIIYEMSIRDFSDHKIFKHRGKFLGVIQEGLKTVQGNPAGLDYLKQLNVTHVQLMPIYDFQTINEKSDLSNQYNWGYDPQQYNVAEGSFIVDVDNKNARVLEFKELVEKLHMNNINVVMDVVYNHVFQPDTFSFNKLLPHYFYSINQNGEYTNEGGVGSINDTTRIMTSKFIVDSCVFWAKEYNVDGFRFDLMGLIDTSTMNILMKKIWEFKPYFVFYGEGWKMKERDNVQYANMYNSSILPRLAHFNDIYRKSIKNEGEHEEPNINQFSLMNINPDFDSVQNAMLGALGFNNKDWFSTSTDQALNYVSIHDGYTIADFIATRDKKLSEERIKIISKMMMMVVITSQGIPIFHSGHEVLRTKQFYKNTYNKNIEVNRFPWENVDKHQDFVQYFSKLIEIRKKFNLFKLKDKQEIEKFVDWSIKDNIIYYVLENNEYKLLVIINLDDFSKLFSINDQLLISNYEVYDSNQLQANESRIYLKEKSTNC